MRGGYVSDRLAAAWCKQLAEGQTVEQIAERWGFAVSTVRKHIKRASAS